MSMKSNLSKRHVTGAIVLIASLHLVGCGRSDIPELGYVEGTVKVNGQPAAGKIVQFYSDEGGRAGTGVTDEEGYYYLTYVDGEEGTKVGPSTVRIVTEWPDGEPPAGESDPIPPKYNSKSDLTRDVQPGNNTFDFDLETK